jgi:NAD-dependent DNA ligase
MTTTSNPLLNPLLKKVDKNESDLAQPFSKVDLAQPFPKVDLAPQSLHSLYSCLAPPFPKVDKVDKDLKKSPENTITIMNEEKRYNESFIDILDQLAAIQTKQGEPFRARAYLKAQETIMTYPKNITSVEDIKGLPNIGPTIIEKLKEFVETGTLRIIEREKTNPVNILADIYGVGPKKAKELVDKGITTIAQLRENQDLLNDVQKVGLQYYEDVLKRIPRAEIDNYRDIIYEVAEPLLGSVEIVGSYRRGAQNSGDIDVIITSPTEKPFIQFIDMLIKQKIIVSVLSRGPSKCLVMAKIPSSNYVRRVDFLYTTPEEFPFAILYFTGSKMFNTMMRQHALNMGLTMNEHGLYKFTNKTKGEKVPHIFKTEKDIFDYLNLQYVKPENRVDCQSLKKVEPNPPLKKVEPNPPLKKVEPNPPLKKVEPNPPLKKVEPNLQIITQLEEPIQLAPKAPKAPKITKTKTLKAKTKKTLIVESDLAPHQLLKKVEQNESDLAPPPPDILVKKGLAPPFPKVDSMTEKELTDLLNYANTMYRNFQPVMTDNEYDILEDYIKEKYPNNKATAQIGATPVTKNKVNLPYFMGSMDKIKPDTNALATWKAKYTGPYVLSCKLDGVSGLYTTEGTKPKLYTRGDGKVGQDISYLIPYLRLPKNQNLVIRGEFIIPKSTFNTKYKTTFANARNMVSGIVNQKSVNPEIMKDVDFVAYEVIKPLLKPSEQFATLEQLDINVVQHKIVGEFDSTKSPHNPTGLVFGSTKSPPTSLVFGSTKSPPNPTGLAFGSTFLKGGKGGKGGLDNELLSETLIQWRQLSPYEIDGIIVTNDQIYPIRKEGNPEHSFAFKMVLSDQIAEAKVVDVIWTASKDGYLKPRVQIEPIHLGGVTIEYATGFNGQFIQENKIGIGAVIELIRSGDVIPYIRKVTTPATETKMPNVPYKWNDTHVDILLEDIDSDEVVKEKILTGFFRGIEVEGLSSGNISRIIAAGYDSIPKILQMTTHDLLQVEGFKEKTAQKLYNNIQTQIKSVPLVTIMAASNIFGRGFNNKKLELIMTEYPDVLQSQDANKVASIKGMATKTADAFVSKIPAFLAFVQEAHLEYKLQTQPTTLVPADISHPLYNKTIVFTGFRDKQLEEQLKAIGAKLGSSVSKNTFVLINKDPLDETGKVLEAKKLNIPIMTPDKFIHLFHLL